MLTSTSDPGAFLLPQPGTAPNTTGSAEQDLRACLIQRLNLDPSW